MRLTASRHRPTEFAFRASQDYDDPYNEITLDVLFTGPDGKVLRVPAFWAGEDIWKIRFAGPQAGEYHFETCCSNAADTGLHGVKGEVAVSPYPGANLLYRHGRLRVAQDKRHFEHADGTPFFWVGDTWWMGLTTRLGWPDGFRELAMDRARKGFNVIQIVAGPYPDMDIWDPRGRNEGGFPFTRNFVSINPVYYDHADLKIAALVHTGLMPCIVGMWGYHLPTLGVEKVKRFWRYLIARYGAYPVTWCVAGEAAMPYYLSQTSEEHHAFQKTGWTEVTVSMRETDPYHNLITVHPMQAGRDQIHDPTLMDFEMLQTGHGDIDTVRNTIIAVRKAIVTEPVMPVIVGEVNYEGILGRCWQNIQRLCFYHAVLRGTAGHTYGANGIWQLNTPELPYGPSPHGRSWGDTPWPVAAQLPGSAQTGIGGDFMRQTPWWDLRPMPEILKPVGEEPSPLPACIEEVEEDTSPYAAIAVGIPRRLRIVYIPMCWNGPVIYGIEPDLCYSAYYFDPCVGRDIPLGDVRPDKDGSWTAPYPPECHDWLLVMRADGP